MCEKILLIDGHSILNRAFYGLPDLTNSEGLHTGAVYGFLNILFKVLGEEKPEYLAVAFDRSEPTFRHAKYPEYKGTRKSMPQELKEQMPLLKEMLEKINGLGIGPGGLGGRVTAMAVNIETYPTHIAGLRMAVNICCHVNRHVVREL